jgi:hypothetical protein
MFLIFFKAGWNVLTHKRLEFLWLIDMSQFTLALPPWRFVTYASEYVAVVSVALFP